MLVEAIYPPKPLFLHHGNQEKKQFILNLPRQKFKEWNDVSRDLSFGWGFGLSVVQIVGKKDLLLKWDFCRISSISW